MNQHIQITIQRNVVIHKNVKVPAYATLRRRLTKMLHSLELFEAEVSIVLTDDHEIQQLNHHYRGIHRPTDVLSFSMREGEGSRFAGHALGDIVLSVETASRQAKQAKRSMLDEVTMLLAHSLLHLLGWDHATRKEDQRMRAKTDELCIAAGGAPLFAMGGIDARGRSVIAKKNTRRRSHTSRKT